MKKGEFIRISKNMVKEYYNRYINTTGDVKKLTSRDVLVIDFQGAPDIYRILLVTMTPDTLYYGVTYYKDTDKLHSYIYENVDNKIIGRSLR